ncbi:membrane protein insertase YidC [Patescibacteria group bacterium]|nr:membrane protein insertase YidC [Patescibacteria group bacterium]
MSWFGTLFNEIFFRPLFNALVFLTDVLPFHDLGLSVIILTLVVRLALFPLTHRSVQTQQKMKFVEPELRKIKEDHKDRQEQARLTMELYKKHGINPFSGILMLFIQLPILIALYFVFIDDISSGAKYLYSFVSLPEIIHTKFLGLIELTQPSIFLAVLTGLSQFVQMKWAQVSKSSSRKGANKKDRRPGDFSQMLTFQMTYMMPALIFFIALRFPAAVSLYWTTINMFSILHEGIVRRKAKILYGKRDQENSRNDSNPN